MTKLVFMGTPAFSVPILEGLIESGYEIQAVVTQPDRPVGRKRVITPTPVKSGSEARYPCAAARENLRFARNGRNH